MPVVTPFFNKSTDTVKGVACRAVLWPTIKSRPSSSQRASGSEAHTSPRP